MPPSVLPAFRRYYLILNFAAFFSGLGHAGFIPLFAWLGVPALAWYNCLSVTSFVLASLLNRRGLHNTAAAIMILEFILHAWLTMLNVGPAYGFQFYLIGWCYVPFLAPAGRRWFKVLAFSAACSSVVLLHHSEGPAPDPFPGGRSAAHLISTFNISFNALVYAFVFFCFREIADKAERAEAEAHARSEQLLHAILPHSIAERLKVSDEAIADTFEEATVLFLDIAGFTPWSSKLTAEEVVAMLNLVFSRLDQLTERLGLEKIKTIGDAYMVAGGVPVPRADHAKAIGCFALAAQGVVDEIAREQQLPLQVRIGIDCGRAVAGVIGQTKFAYDLWGDMVNTASRMESHGVPGRIHVTTAFHDAAQDCFDFEYRGEIEVKGKGVMQTWFLAAQVPGPLSRSPGHGLAAWNREFRAPSLYGTGGGGGGSGSGSG